MQIMPQIIIAYNPPKSYKNISIALDGNIFFIVDKDE